LASRAVPEKRASSASVGHVSLKRDNPRPTLWLFPQQSHLQPRQVKMLDSVSISILSSLILVLSLFLSVLFLPSMSSKPTSFEPRMLKRPPFTVEVPGSPQVEGETVPRRNANFPEELLSQPEAGISTIYDIVKHSASKYGDQKAIGSRTLIKKHHETKKVKKMIDGELQHVDKNWTYFELSGYQYLTFNEYQTLVSQVGAGLRKLGLAAPDRVHMFASTSAHWLSVAHGAMSQSMAIVTAYDTLGEEGLRHSLLATRAKAIFVEPHLIKTLTNTLKEARHIEYIIHNTDSEHEIRQEDLDVLKTSHDHLTVVSYEELRQLGESNPVPATPPNPEDLACIMYTSGSGGTPKGVELTHRNVIAAGMGPFVNIRNLLTEFFQLLEETVYTANTSDQAITCCLTSP
jgi:long-chain acyl-CoA synthetase